MNHANLPSDPALAGKVVDAQAANDRVRLERGIMGWLFGSRDHVPNNVAGVVVVGGFIAVCVILYRPGDFASKKDSLAAISSLVTLALGFLFGRASKD
jgi:hypothetical protein